MLDEICIYWVQALHVMLELHDTWKHKEASIDGYRKIQSKPIIIAILFMK